MDNETEQLARPITGAWGTFELRVAALVSTMRNGGSFSLHAMCDDGVVDECAVECDAGCATVRIDSGASGLITLEFDEGDTEDPTGRGFALAENLVEIIRNQYGLPHPGLMTVSAPAELRDRIGILGLTKRSKVSDDHVLVEDDTALEWPSSVDEVRAAVLDHLQEHYDSEVEADDDGDFPIKVAGVRVWVKAVDDQPAVRLLTPIVVGVRSRQMADTELNVANRGHLWARWVRRRKVVWQELTLPAYPFVPVQFDEMLRLFVAACVEARPDMADRLYGQEAR